MHGGNLIVDSRDGLIKLVDLDLMRPVDINSPNTEAQIRSAFYQFANTLKFVKPSTYTNQGWQNHIVEKFTQLANEKIQDPTYRNTMLDILNNWEWNWPPPPSEW